MSRVARIAFTVSLVVAAFLVIWKAAWVFLLIFGGILLAVFLNGVAAEIARFTPISMRMARIFATLLILLGVGTGAWFATSSLLEQLDQLLQQLPQSFDALRRQTSQSGWSQWLFSRISAESLSLASLWPRGLGLLSGVLGIFTSIIIVVFIGVYCGLSPGVYRRGVLRAVPVARRDEADQLLSELDRTLRAWIVGKLVAMTIVAMLTTAGLYLIGMPLALILGLLAGLLSFVPYLGPVVAYVPALILALGQAPELAVWVTGVYLIVQLLESYLITPLVQRQAVSIPPAVLIAMQVFLGVILGLGGIILATPLTASLMVLIKELGPGYVNQPPD